MIHSPDDVEAPADVVDDGVSDVMAEDEVVHVSPGAAELAEALEHGSTFVPEVPDWNGPDSPAHADEEPPD